MKLKYQTIKVELLYFLVVLIWVKFTMQNLLVFCTVLSNDPSIREIPMSYIIYGKRKVDNLQLKHIGFWYNI